MEYTVDGHPQVWLLYQPEPFEFGSDDDRSIHLWVRRCRVFFSRQAAIDHLKSILGHEVVWKPYNELFPELWIGVDYRGVRWLMEPAGILR